MVASARLWWKKIKQHPIVILLKSCWQQIKHHPAIILLFPLLVALTITFIIVSYRFNWAWTGFTGTAESYKTLYDWLQLLFVPIALTGFGFFLNYRERKTEERRIDKEQKAAESHVEEEQKREQKRAQTRHEIAEDNQREVALQAYINEMSELLLHHNLRKSEEDDEVRTIARVRTLTILPRLDGNRKGIMLKFLHESGLIDKVQTIVDLSGADLSGAILKYAELSGARLHRVNLSDSLLDSANLSNADLRKSRFSGAYLFCTNLSDANLRGAYLDVAFEEIELDFGDAVHEHISDLTIANLSGADLSGATMHRAILDGADLSNANLKNANLCQATLYGTFIDIEDPQLAEFYGVSMGPGFQPFANLNGADLSGAELSLAKVTDEQLTKAKSLKGARMPDGSIHQ
jgi:uncharacterized protein YjbI with pentapeptide repeats